jgi:putative glycerol-1-phosphate prenyltransferase
VKKLQLLPAFRSGKKQLAVLIDPDHSDEKQLEKLCRDAVRYKVDYFFIGGSLLLNGNLSATLKTIRKNCAIPLILFPGNSMQIDVKADAILLLSLISGRNAELLIGQHVHAAPLLKKSKLEIIPTGYILIDGGKPTSVSYVSNTLPIPNNKPAIALCTALAGEQLGLQCIYLEAGSGAEIAVSSDLIATVRKEISVPLIVGGGIRTQEQAQLAWKAGADIIVVGSAVEKDPSFLKSLKEIKRTDL